MADQGGSTGSSGFDMSKLTVPSKIVGGSTIVYIIWVFLPFWYHFSAGVLGSYLALAGVNTNISGFRGVTLVAWLLAVVALVGVVLTALGMEMKMSIKPGTVQLGIAGAGAVLTLLGIVAKPTGFGITWGWIVGLVVALVWLYGAYMWHSQPEGSSPPAAGGGGFTS